MLKIWGEGGGRICEPLLTCLSVSCCSELDVKIKDHCSNDQAQRSSLFFNLYSFPFTSQQWVKAGEI